MNGSINYIVAVNSLFKPIIVGTPELKSLYEDLISLGADQNGGLEILDAKRMVITNAGKVVYTQVTITFDKSGLEIRDRYGCLLDSYSVPEPVKKRYKVIRSETWTNDITVEAESEEEAIEIVSKMVQDGEFDVLEGWCDDVDHDAHSV